MASRVLADFIHLARIGDCGVGGACGGDGNARTGPRPCADDRERGSRQLGDPERGTKRDFQ